jgi:uncharacterized lipoprotein NlpE involved in copper resistance
MIKKIAITLFAGLALFGCNNDKKEETALLNDVIKTHDKLMTDDGQIMKNKMLLDSATASKDSVTVYKKLLDSADNSMMDWMHKFNPDFTGKSHSDIMTYLTAQKAQILKLDSQINSAIKASGDYIQRVKETPAQAAPVEKTTTTKKHHKRRK